MYASLLQIIHVLLSLILLVFVLRTIRLRSNCSGVIARVHCILWHHLHHYHLISAFTTTSLNSFIWHRRLGHPNKSTPSHILSIFLLLSLKHSWRLCVKNTNLASTLIYLSIIQQLLFLILLKSCILIFGHLMFQVSVALNTISFFLNVFYTLFGYILFTVRVTHLANTCISLTMCRHNSIIPSNLYNAIMMESMTTEHSKIIWRPLALSFGSLALTHRSKMVKLSVCFAPSTTLFKRSCFKPPFCLSSG